MAWPGLLADIIVSKAPEAVKIATWNVNSIRARQERLLDWLQRGQPDVVCLQEIKVTDEAFPYEAFQATGYHAAVRCRLP